MPIVSKISPETRILKRSFSSIPDYFLRKYLFLYKKWLICYQKEQVVHIVFFFEILLICFHDMKIIPRGIKIKYGVFDDVLCK